MISYHVDMRGDFGPTREQGRRQTCLAFAASDAHALVHGRPASMLSTEYAHYSACTRMPSFQPHLGTSGSAMLDALALDGQPPEEEWPYLAELPSDLTQYRPPNHVSGLLRHFGEQLSTLDEVERALSGRRPVIMGLALSISFFRLSSAAILPADSDQNVVGTHAVLAVGLFSNGGDKGYLIRNSWGTKWGANGHGFVLRSYIEPRTLFLGVFRG
jgi:hypothetical protein